MVIMVIVGVICTFGEVLIENEWYHTFFAASFSIGIILWATVFVEKWK